MNSDSEKLSTSFADLIRAAVNDQVQRNQDAVEAMCWKMLAQTDTRYGVFVEERTDGSVKVSLHPAVEFLTIVWVKKSIGGMSHGE